MAFARPSVVTTLHALLIPALVMAMTVAPLTATTARAGQPSDYAEFPYSPTNYDEPYRGQFHFSSQNGWMNDLNAPILYRGVYHIFYQHFPDSLLFLDGPSAEGAPGQNHWGHATSPDLVHWTQQPIALEPNVHPGWLWSGGGWVDDTNASGLKTGSHDPILLFTGKDYVRVAYSVDGGDTFQMARGGADIIPSTGEARDPKVFWDSARNRWGMVMYAQDGGRNATFFSSTNLLDWTKRGQYRGGDWFYECPDIFELPVDGAGVRKWVLNDASGQYVIGSLNNEGVFVSDWAEPQRMDEGEGGFSSPFYAGLTFTQLPNDRIVQLAWQGGNAGSVWTGNATFPTELALRTFSDGIRLTRTPVAEIETIRSGSLSWADRTITTDPATNPFEGVTADTYEIEATFDLGGATASAFGFSLHRRSSDGAADRNVTYDRNNQTLDGRRLAPIDNRVTIRMLVDRGQLEVFGNGGRLVISHNVDFRSSPEFQGIKLYADNGSVRLQSMSFHRLGSTWPTRPPRTGPGPIRWGGNAKKCVDVDGDSSRVQLYTCFGNSQQTWTHGTDGTLRANGLCLELPPGATGNRTLVRAAACTGSANQRWTAGPDLRLTNAAAGRCLDVDSGNQTNGRQLQVYDCTGGFNSNQRWDAPVTTTSGPGTGTTTGTGAIRFAAATAKCVDRDGAKVQIWDCLGNPQQTWTLGTDATLSTGGVCMAGGGGNNSLVLAVGCTGSTDQQWTRTADGQHTNRATGRCLDLADGDQTNGRPLQVYDCTGGSNPNQRWNGPA